MRTPFGALFAAITVAAGLSLAPGALAQDVIRIGAPLPITGPLAPEAAKQKRGYDLWAELVNQAGGKAVGLTGQDGVFIRARKMLLPGKDNGRVDLGQVGEIESIDPSVISALEQGGFIPVVAPIGTGVDGTTYNINADLVAGKVAEVLKAEKLVLLTNTPGVLDKNGTLDRKSTRLNSSHMSESRMPSSA